MVFLCLGAACGGEERIEFTTLDNQDYSGSDLFYDFGDSAVVGGHYQGTFGDQEVDGDITEASGWSSREYAHIDLFVEYDDGISMVRFLLADGFSAESWQPGAVHTSGEDTYDSYSNIVHAVGCTGLEMYKWDYDGIATDTVMTVSGTPGERIVDFSMVLADGSSIDGFFVLQ